MVTGLFIKYIKAMGYILYIYMTANDSKNRLKN